MRRAIYAAAVVAVTFGPATAGEKRELGSHEHGVGHFNIAFEGDQIAMELEAPGADIVGFEHAAKSAEDKAAIEAARAKLSDALSLFVLPAAAGCSLASADVGLVAEGGDHHDHGEHGHGDHGHGEHAHDDHGHEEHAHDDHGRDKHAEGEHAHDDHGHDDHAHDDHGHDEHADAGHTEFHAEYRLTCANPDEIDGIRFAYFEAFPNAEELEIQMIGADGSRGFEVTRDAPEIQIPGSS